MPLGRWISSTSFFDMAEAFTFFAGVAFAFWSDTIYNVNNRGVAAFRTPPDAGVAEFGMVPPGQVTLAAPGCPISKTI